MDYDISIIGTVVNICTVIVYVWILLAFSAPPGGQVEGQCVGRGSMR